MSSTEEQSGGKSPETPVETPKTAVEGPKPRQLVVEKRGNLSSPAPGVAVPPVSQFGATPSPSPDAAGDQGTGGQSGQSSQPAAPASEGNS